MKDIHGIIWDLDGTLYPFTPEFIRSCNLAAAKAAQILGANITYEQAVDLAVRSEDEHGYSLHGFIHEHRLSYESLHHPFHEHIDDMLISPCVDTAQMLRKISIPQVIATNASRTWANRVLNRLNIADIFAPHHIIAMEDVNYIPKARAPDAFQKAVDIMGVPPQNILVVEDMSRNLKTAKSLGMVTMLISPAPSSENYIDHHVPDVQKLLADWQH
jgi:putative hydrolase of the HAD superfamily